MRHLLLELPFHLVEVVHSPLSPTIPHEAQQPLVIKFYGFPSTLVAGYDTPFGQIGVTQAPAPSLKHGQPALLAHPDKTSYIELADRGNIQIHVSVGDDAPDDLPTFIGVHGMAGDLKAANLHEILSHLAKENWGWGVVFNLRGCGESTATSPAFHHGGSTSDLGAVVTWVAMKWPKSKIYVIGTSLGAISTTKALGQWGEDFFNPAVGAFYAKLVKKNKDAFDLDHWLTTRPRPFPSSTPSPSLPFPPSINSESPRESGSLTQDSRNSSFAASTTPSTSIFSSVPSLSTPGTSVPPSYISPLEPSAPVVAEHAPEIKAAIADSLKEITVASSPSDKVLQEPCGIDGSLLVERRFHGRDVCGERSPQHPGSMPGRQQRRRSTHARSGLVEERSAEVAIRFDGGSEEGRPSGLVHDEDVKEEEWKQAVPYRCHREWFKANKACCNCVLVLKLSTPVKDLFTLKVIRRWRSVRPPNVLEVEPHSTGSKST